MEQITQPPINDYYSRTYIQHLIRESVVKREVAVLGDDNANVRALKIMCLYNFERILRVVNWNKHKQNIYRSTATLKDYPPDFTFNPKLRSKETIVWFQEQYDKDIAEYDLFFDFDKPRDVSWMELYVAFIIAKSYKTSDIISKMKKL